jgi:hypothetical protein
MQQPPFQQAIESTRDLIDKVDRGTLADDDAARQMTELLAELATARGFFVSLLTNDWSFENKIPDIVIDTIRSNPEHAFNLLAKNLAMASAAKVAHQKAKNVELEKGSQRVIDRTSYIIVSLRESEMREELSDLLTALEDRLKNVTTSGGNAGTYNAFLERQSYNDEQMLVTCTNLKTVIAQLGASKAPR